MTGLAQPKLRETHGDKQAKEMPFPILSVKEECEFSTQNMEKKSHFLTSPLARMRQKRENLLPPSLRLFAPFILQNIHPCMKGNV